MMYTRLDMDIFLFLGFLFGFPTGTVFCLLSQKIERKRRLKREREEALQEARESMISEWADIFDSLERENNNERGLH